MIENIRLSFQGIWAHKMRSFLTMLGIIIGIASIIAIVSTIKGTNEQIKDNLVGSGDNTVDVKLYNSDWEYVSGEGFLPEGVMVIDEDVKQQVLDIDEISDMCTYRKGILWQGVYYKGKSLDSSSIVGVDDRYFDMLNYRVTQGRYFVEDDRINYRKYVVIDTAIAANVFTDENPVGQTMEICGDAYVVIGVVEKTDQFEPTCETITDWYTYYGDAASGQIFVSDQMWPMMFKYDEPYNVMVKARSTDEMTEAGKKTSDILNNTLIIAGESGEEGDGSMAPKYKSQDLLETAKKLQDVSNSTSKQLIWIASISLLVGGIGVMNIMLVSVTERTREIGLKKALGARKSVILAQFLTEAAVLTSLGGLLGVGVGIGFSYIVSNVAEVPVAISGGAILISVAFSMIIGIVFGLLPSVKAAKLNPIDALRYE